MLLSPELMEAPLDGEQLIDRSVLDHSTILDEEHAVGMTNARQSVGDDHPGA